MISSRLISFSLVGILMFMMFGFAQEKAANEDQSVQVDERIWSITYWQMLANKGLVEKAKAQSGPAAIYTGSRIHARTVLQNDVPDIAITSDNNVTQSEISVFVNPFDNNKVLNSNNSTPNPVAGIFGTSGFFTTDGGNVWGGSPQGTGGSNSGDPAAVISAATGTYFVGYIAANSGNGCAYSTDEGATWTHVQVAPNPGSLADKNHLWIDNSPTSPHFGNLYAAWTDFGGAFDGDVVVSRSTDDGRTWSTRVPVSTALPGFKQGVNMQTGPNGEVYAFYTDYVTGGATDEPAYGLTISTDGGASWGTPTQIITNTRGIRSSGTSKNMRSNSFPACAVDISNGPRRGWMYMAWGNIGTPGVNTGPDISIYIISSSDGGSTWTSPVRVNQDDFNNGSEHYLPWLTCDPETGALSAIWYDDRNVGGAMVETYVGNSIDGGVTWEDFKVSDVAFTPAPIPGLAGGYFGDYIGISANGGKVYPIWTDNRTGSGDALAYTNPYILADPADPNAPSGVSIYSDYTTPTSISITWDDPTNYVSGDTLLPANFSIEIARDGTLLTTVASGVGNYTDTGLTDGQSYAYTLTTRDNVDSLSIPASASWTAGGAVTPSGPANFTIIPGATDLTAQWDNPTTNVDGTPLDDLAEIRLYEGGVLLTTFTVASGDTGATGSGTFNAGGNGTNYHVTAVDNEAAQNESVSSNTVRYFPPIPFPIFDEFPVAGDPDPALWINSNGVVDAVAINPPSPTLTLDLDGMPDGGDTTASFPFNLDGEDNSGILLSYYYQPQGSGNAPETGDVLRLEFLTNQGTWVLIREYPGTGQVPFVNEVIDVASEDPGIIGATFFHPLFQFRFTNIGTASTTSSFDNWLIDNVFFGVPTGAAQMDVSPQSLGDTLLVGGSSSASFRVSNIAPTPTTLNYTVSEDPAADWVSASPTSGSLTSGTGEDIVVTFDASVVGAGTYTTDLIVAGDDPSNPEDTVSVTLVVNSAPIVGFSPDSMIFGVLNPGDSDSMTMTITNTGAGPLDFSLTDEDAFGPVSMRLRKPAPRQYPDFYYSMELAKGEVDTRRGNPRPMDLGGPDAFGYRWIDSNEPGGPAFNWIDITGDGTPITLTDDSSFDVPLPFTFNFYGQDKNSITISSNGYLTFGIDGTDFSNDAIPTTTDPNDFIAPFWDDLNPALGGQVYYRVTSSEIIVQYDQINRFQGTLPNTFQVIVRANGQMIFQYLDMQDLGNATATVGIENSDASDGLEVAFNTTYVENNLAVRIAADAGWLATNPTFGTVPAGGTMDVQVLVDATGLLGGEYRGNINIASNDPVTPDTSMLVVMTVGGTPVVNVTPDPLVFPDPVFIGNNEVRSLYVRNEGNAPLNVSDVAVDNSDYSLSATAFAIPPFDSVEVMVTFTPAAAGVSNATLTVTSDDPANPTYTAGIEGEGILSPEIAVSPDSAVATIVAGDSTDVTVSISNTAPTGAANLEFSAQLSNLNKTSISSLLPPTGPAEAVQSNGTASLERAPSGGSTYNEHGVEDQLSSVVTVGYGADVFGGAWYRIPLGSPSGATNLGGVTEAFFCGDFDTQGNFAAIDNNNSNLALIDTATGTATVLGTLSGVAGDTWTGLTYDPTSGTWYASSTNGATANLYIVDPGTATATLIGSSTAVPLLIDIAFSPTGVLWGHDIAADAMFTIDPATFTATQVGLTGFDANFAQGMAFDWETGDLFLAAYNNAISAGELRLVDQATGATTLIGPIATGASVEVGAFGIGGPAAASWVELIGATDGVVAPGDVGGLTVRFFGAAAQAGGDTTYTGDIEIATNDVTDPTVLVPIRLTVTDSVVGIDVLNQIPTTYEVSRNFPNPFNPSTTIQYQLPESNDVRLVIYNVIGQKVRTLVNQRHEAGRYQVRWDGLNDAGAQVGSGIYIYRFESGSFQSTQKMMLIK